MFLKDKNGHLIKSVPTSFELSYASICAEEVSEQDLLPLQSEKDNGWIKFYYKDYSEAYTCDLDDTSLYYIALLKKDFDKYKANAFKILSEVDKLRTVEGLVCTWPDRPADKPEQADPVVNLHYLWLSHLLGKRDELIEAYLIKWIKKDKITTLYYHNEIFILFSCLKASQDFISSEFKDNFQSLVNEKIKKNNFSIPSEFKKLKFPQGVFRHIGKDVFFHFFNEDIISESKELLNETDLNNYYESKKNKPVNDFDVLASYDFQDSIFHKMGQIRLSSDKSIVVDDFCILDTTIYQASKISQGSNLVTSKSLSVRPHLNRALALLPSDIEAIIRKYWQYCVNYLESLHLVSYNSFITLQFGDRDIFPHRHIGSKSTMTFIMAFGEGDNDTKFIVGEDEIQFINTNFFMLHFAGEEKLHSVIKKDKKTYLYFIFDLLESAPEKLEFKSLKNL